MFFRLWRGLPENHSASQNPAPLQYFRRNQKDDFIVYAVFIGDGNWNEILAVNQSLEHFIIRHASYCFSGQGTQ